MSVSIDDHGSCKRAATRVRKGAAQIQPKMQDASVKQAEKLKQEIVRSAASILPKRGGLAQFVSRMDINIERIADGARVVGRSDYDIQNIDNGSVAHPVYGNRSVWVRQQVTPKFWSAPIAKSEPDFRREFEKAQDDVAKNIERG